MSEDRETPADDSTPRGEQPETVQSPEAGAPVEEAEATRTEVLAAVERATAETSSDGGDAIRGAEAAEAPIAVEPAVSPADGELSKRTENTLGLDTQPHVERPVIAAQEELPSAAATPATGVAPAAGAAATAAAAPLGVERDGEIRISADHPMASLYIQTPMPPDLRGNRGAGALIALLATLAFAAVYAGALALWLAPDFPPSTFLSEGLLPFVMSWGFIITVAGFFLALLVLVLIVGRAGWWAYVLGGFLVGVAVWAAAVLGYSFDAKAVGAEFTGWNPLKLLENVGLWIPALAAGIVAREATVWFGAWIGARGRRVTRQNAEALAEYEAALAEVQAKQ